MYLKHKKIIATGTFFFFFNFDHLKEKSDFNYSNKYIIYVPYQFLTFQWQQFLIFPCVRP